MKSPYVHTKYSEQLQNPTLIDNSSCSATQNPKDACPLRFTKHTSQL